VTGAAPSPGSSSTTSPAPRCSARISVDWLEAVVVGNGIGKAGVRPLHCNTASPHPALILHFFHQGHIWLSVFAIDVQGAGGVLFPKLFAVTKAVIDVMKDLWQRYPYLNCERSPSQFFLDVMPEDEVAELDFKWPVIPPCTTCWIAISHQCWDILLLGDQALIFKGDPH
jgi:hypothetical protein